MPFLVVHTPNHPPQRVALSGPVILGRSAGCEIWIEDGLVSRHHCRFEPRGDDWFVVDLESRNGIYVDGQRVQEAMLQDLTTVYVGGSDVDFHMDRISDRPADPNESAEFEASILDQESASENTTIVGQSVTAPGQSKDDTSVPVDRSRATSLPFTRPPPRPIVREELSEDA